MKLNKSFRNHSDLSAVKNNVETLMTFYPPDATLEAIFKNVQSNEDKWEECPKCKGNGIIRQDIGVKGNKQMKKTFGFFKCDKCKGTRWIRKPKEKKK